MPSAGSTVSASKAACVTRAELNRSCHIGWQKATPRIKTAAGQLPHCVLMAKGPAMLTVKTVVLLYRIGVYTTSCSGETTLALHAPSSSSARMHYHYFLDQAVPT